MIKRSRITQLKQSSISELRDSILAEQGGICPICKLEVKSAALDHHHKKRVKGTGLVRGVLCRTCNILIAKMENNCVRYGVSQVVLPFVLRNMAEYLEKPHLPYIHPSEAPKKPKLTKSSYNTLARAMIKLGEKRNIPPYPKSGNLTKKLSERFNQFDIEPRYYK